MARFDPALHDGKPLVPELIVSDLQVSLRFWRDLLGFRVLYERPADGFAYLERERAEVMLEVLGERSWLVGELRRSFGRGINLQIETTSLSPLLEALGTAGWPLYRAAEERWYRTGDEEAGQRQFVVQDPDGYLLRFPQSLGVRPSDGWRRTRAGTAGDARTHQRAALPARAASRSRSSAALSAGSTTG